MEEAPVRGPGSPSMTATMSHVQEPVTGACGPLGASALSHVELGGTLGTGSVTIHHLNLEGLTVKAKSKRRENATPNHAQASASVHYRHLPQFVELMANCTPLHVLPHVIRLQLPAMPRETQGLKGPTVFAKLVWMVAGDNGPTLGRAVPPVGLATKRSKGSAIIQPQPMEGLTV